MKKIQVNILSHDTRDATGKAKIDVEEILYRNGWNKLCQLSTNKVIRFIQQLLHVLLLSSKVVLVLQYPTISSFLTRMILYCPSKKILLLHDISSLRWGLNNTKEMQLLKQFDAIICHSLPMAEYLKSNGVSSHFYVLDLFDYLMPDTYPIRNNYDKNTIVFAGNLSKTGFLNQLGSLDKLHFNLYGVRSPKVEELALIPNVNYRGSFSSEQIVGEIEGGWGLVWDGESLDSCTGLLGNYLRYNASHKFSMYIAACRPVIVWNQSAISAFVDKYHIGISIESLTNLSKKINDITDEEYQLMRTNIVKLKEKITSGAFLSKVLNDVQLDFFTNLNSTV